MANISLLLHCSDSTSHHSQAITFLAKHFSLSDQDILKNPDIHIINSDKDSEEFSALKIEQVRDLNAEMQLRPFQGVGELKQAVFVICKIDLASVPAQNALLKSLEEPPAHVQFLLTTDQPQRILPTILSRVKVVESTEFRTTQAAASTSNSTETPINLAEFQTASYSALIEKAGTFKEKREAISFLKELLNTLHRDNILQPSSQKTKLLQETVVAMDYLGKNVNTRLVLENLLFQFKSL